MSEFQHANQECISTRRAHAVFLLLVAIMGILLASSGARLTFYDNSKIDSLFDVYFLVALATGVLNSVIAVRLFVRSSDRLRTLYLRSSIALIISLPILWIIGPAA